ncbi:polyprenyl synthetase family protein [Virgibacillus xinjiangensis]|uniref:Polyprenyl synthetase family protein n=1 Tax=Virgibacillus xinjiangensis TaxID=393090 RepID=A0ABV7CRH6_9BACI
MDKTLSSFIEEKKQLVEVELKRYLNTLEVPRRLKDSMLYSLEAGGKRLRPILLLASYKAYGGEGDKALSAAAGLEMVHTYSLIHDDLPAMDDDDLRRGKPTNHKVFDEATAILAGDALLTYSFEIILNDPQLNGEEKLSLTKALSHAAGPAGMVGGQIQDMQAEKNPVTLEELETIHDMKTGELLKFAVYAGAYLANANEKQLGHIQQFAYYLGLIFQVQDDILDVTGEEDKIGKAVGSDQNNEKSTYPKLLGLDGAIDKKYRYVQQAKAALESAGANGTLLESLADFFSERDH